MAVSAYAASWPLGVAELLMAVSDGLVTAINIRTAKRAQNCCVHCSSLLEDEEEMNGA